MAFQMVHMEIAYRLMERLEIEHGREAFLLGCVAPDSVHFRFPYKVEDKIHTHLFEDCGPWGDTQDYERWIENMKAFWEKYGRKEQDVSRKSFLLGIYVHCLTDYCNDKLIWRTLQNKFIPPMTDAEFKNAFYREAQQVDKWLFQNSEHTEEICRLLRNSTEFDLDGYLLAQDIRKMKTHLLENQYHFTEKVIVDGFKYYQAERLLGFVDEVTDYIVHFLDAEKRR